MRPLQQVNAREAEMRKGMKQILVAQNEAGQRLDKLLAKVLNKAPKSFIYKMLRKKNITLNDKKADGSEKLVLQDEIKLFLSEETIAQFSEVQETAVVEAKLDIIYEDQHILLINKPSGVLSQKAQKDDVSMVEYMISYLLQSGQISREELSRFKPALCNRLDRNTGGLLIAGKTLIGLQEMASLLKKRTLEKYYLCIVKGKVEDKRRIEGYLSKDEDKNQVKIYQKQLENTEYICTEYEPIAYSESKDKTEDNPLGNYTLLSVKLITGKSHQIRDTSC